MRRPDSIAVRTDLPLATGTLAGLALLIVDPIAWGLLSRTALKGLELAFRVQLHLVFSWLTVMLLVLIVLTWERRGLASIGVVRFRLVDLAYAAGGLLAATALVYLTMPLIETLGLGTLEQGVRNLVLLPLWLRAAAAITAGVTEEIMFRGFLVERIASLTGRLWLGALLSWAIFTALHAPFWGIGGAIQIGAMSIVTYVIYVRRRSVVPCVLLHVTNDLYAFLLVPLMIPEFP